MEIWKKMWVGVFFWTRCMNMNIWYDIAVNWLAEMCAEGYVSRTGLQPCFPCPRGYFQPERGRSSCFLCPGGVRTHEQGSTHISACEGVLNDAAAASYMSSSVPTTRLVINDCFADPCLNNATCISLNAGYTCQCQPGWTGNPTSTVNLTDRDGLTVDGAKGSYKPVGPSV